MTTDGPAAVYSITSSTDLTEEHIRTLNRMLGRKRWWYIRLHKSATTIWLMDPPKQQNLTVIRLMLSISNERHIK